MIPEPTTWGDVWQYAYVQDKSGEVWKIVGEKSGWIKMINAQGREVDMVRPDPDTPVVTMAMTEPEAQEVIYRHFPGAQVIDIKEDA